MSPRTSGSQKVKSICIFLACALLLLTGCSTQENTGRRHLFWKVSDSNSTVYLLGSLHFADSTFYPLDSVIENAFDRSEELAVEIDISNDSIVHLIAALGEKYGRLPDSLSLDSILPDSISYRLDSLCLSWKLSLGTFNRFKPWAAAMSVEAVGIMRLGYDDQLGIDRHFLSRAHEAGKPVSSIETVEEQIYALAGIGTSDSLGLFYLSTVLREMAYQDSSVRGLMRAWKAGNDSLFCVFMNLDTVRLTPSDSLLKKQINDLLYYSRNRSMAETISQYLAEDRKIFVVVGAMHLAGNHENVIDILRRKGFTIEQL